MCHDNGIETNREIMTWLGFIKNHSARPKKNLKEKSLNVNFLTVICNHPREVVKQVRNWKHLTVDQKKNLLDISNTPKKFPCSTKA